MAKKGKKLIPAFVKARQEEQAPVHIYKQPLDDEKSKRAREATNKLLSFWSDTDENIKKMTRAFQRSPLLFATKIPRHIESANTLFREMYNIKPTTLVSFLEHKATDTCEQDRTYVKNLSDQMSDCLTFLSICQVSLNVEQHREELVFALEESILTTEDLLAYLDQAGLKDMQYDDEYLYINERNEARLAFILTHAYPTLMKLDDPIVSVASAGAKILEKADRDVKSYENKLLQHYSNVPQIKTAIPA